MTKVPPRTLRIAVDVSEPKHGKQLVFPEWIRWWGGNGPRSTTPILVKIIPVVMPVLTGDYVVYDSPDHFGDEQYAVAVIEAKRALTELHTNLETADHQRLVREWKRIVGIPHRAVLLDLPTTELFTASHYVEQPMRVMDLLLRDCGLYGIDLLHVPPGRSRVRTGEFAARWLISKLHAWRRIKERASVCVVNQR